MDLEKSMSEADSPEKSIFTLNSLEKALRGPNGSAVKTKLLDRLDLLLQKMTAKMSTGILQPEFVRAGIIVKGLSAARDIVQITHQQRGGNTNA